MCFVLDINCFHIFFNTSHDQHDEFEPLLKWLYNDPRTSLVYGGTKYRKELGKLNKYFEHIAELKRARKINEISNRIVNEEEKRIQDIVQKGNLDDAHIIAIFCASGCMIFASNDKRADPFIRMTGLYPKGQSRPHIYRNKVHAKSLLQKKNIVRLRNCSA